MDPEEVAKAKPAGARGFLRGELHPTAIGFAVTAILLGAIASSAWWAVRTESMFLEKAQGEQARAVGGALARSVEVLLAENQLTAVRRIVAETAQDCDLAGCRIVLPDGQVVADANPGRITLRELPPRWSGTAVAPDAASSPATRTFPLAIPGRGTARLEITASGEGRLASDWTTQAGMGAICVVGLLTLMVLYRRVGYGLRGVWAIRQALVARETGQTSPAALEVNPEWGLEAQAWNRLLNQGESEQRVKALEKTKEALQTRRSYGGDLAAACDGLSQGLILVDREMRATYANGAAAVLLQTTREKTASANLSDLIADQRVLEAVEASTTGPMQGRTIVEVQRDDAGGKGVLRFIVRPVRREDWGVAMIVIEDITQQRMADEARNAFVAQATHELRGPLTNIRAYAEMALDEGKADPAVQANCLSIINQETFRLDRMVGDILSIAEIEAGTLTLKRDDVRLDELFPELQADYAAQAKDKEITIAFDLPPKLPVMKGDREKIALGLHNLIGNALKYTPSGGQVRVAVVIDEGKLVVDVSDTGIGMTEDDMQHVFEKFYRAKDRRVAKVKGSGLGLAIAREVVRMHGGDIIVRSELDKGSAFTLTLPVGGESA